MNQAEKNYLESIRLWGAQVKQSFREASLLKLPKAYKSANQAVVCGMGGSQLGADLLNSLWARELKLPIVQVRDYHLPGFANAKTLVFLTSYSGATEEVLSAGQEARKAKAKIAVIASGGKLAAMAKKNHWPLYQFKGINNPSGQPRMGTGYILGGLLAVLRKLGQVKIIQAQIDRLDSSVLASFEKYNDKAFIVQLAEKLVNKIPVIVSAEHLVGNAHVMANQINESAKQTALYYSLPELNHHLLEGLSFPKTNRQSLIFLFFNSVNYYLKNQARLKLTEEVLAKQKIKFRHFEFKGAKLEESAELLVLGSLLSYQLAKLNKVQPTRIPWVNYFKSRL